MFRVFKILGAAAWMPPTAALLALGCAPRPQPAMVNPKYKPAGLEGRIVHLAPIVKLSLRNHDDFEDDFDIAPGDSASRLAATGELFHGRIREAGGGIRWAFDTASAQPSQWVDTLLPVIGDVGMDLHEFSYPGPAWFRERGVEPDLVLQVSHLELKRGDPEPKVADRDPPSATPDGVPYENPKVYGTPRTLALRGRYLLWDSRAGEPVVHGRFEAYSSFQLAMTRGNWKDVAGKAAAAMMSGFPRPHGVEAR